MHTIMSSHLCYLSIIVTEEKVPWFIVMQLYSAGYKYAYPRES